MGWLPGATVRDVGAPARYSNGPMRSYRGVVLHVNDANSDDLYGWITGNGQMSCHWQVLKDGTVYQYIDTRYSSWCQAAGNDDWLSIETSGFPGEPLTDAQVTACGRIMAYAHAEHGIPLQLADTTAGSGLGWHGMGGAAWGGHTGCPGDLRKAQRPRILQLAGGTGTNAIDPTRLEDDMTPEQAAQLQALYDRRGKIDTASWAILGGSGQPGVRDVLASILARQGALEAALAKAGQDGADLTAITAAAKAGADQALDGLKLTISKEA